MKYLIILPHPDDETYFVSGLIQKLKRLNNEIRIIILTKGGAGKNYSNYKFLPWRRRIAKRDERSLKVIRTEEFEEAIKILNIQNYKLYDFEDGKLNHEDERLKIKNAIIQEIKNFLPDSVITYDNTGVTGHPDHIAVSEIIYNLQKSDKYFFKLLFITAGKFENKIYKHLENYKYKFEQNFIIRLPIFDTIRKARALNVYKSQFTFWKRIQIFVKFILDRQEYFVKINDHEPIFEFVEFEI